MYCALNACPNAVQGPEFLPKQLLILKALSGLSKMVFYKSGEMRTLRTIADLLFADGQLDAAEKAAEKVINLGDREPSVSDCHILLGRIHCERGNTESAITHFEIVLRIASPFNRHGQLFSGHYNLAKLFAEQGRFNDAHTHIGHAKPYAHATNNNLRIGRAMYLQAWIWYREGKFVEAKAEALHTVTVFEELGAMEWLKGARKLLQAIEEEIDKWFTEGLDFSSGEPPETVLLPTITDVSFSGGSFTSH